MTTRVVSHFFGWTSMLTPQSNSSGC